MQRLSEQIKIPSLYSLLCRSFKGDFLPFVDPLEANTVRKICDEFGVGIISCKHPNVKDYIKEIGGLHFSSNIGNKNSLWRQLSLYIPIISCDFFNYNADVIDYNMIAISLKDIFTSPPKKYMGRLRVGNLKIKKDLLESPIFKNKKVILFSSGCDVLIEKVWQESERLNLFSEIAKMGFFLVTGMNFSVFFGECPVGQAINLKKSIEYSALLQKSGVFIIPHLYWIHEFHLQRWVKWLNENSSIDLITVNCQMGKTFDDCQIISEGIQYLIKYVKHELHFLLEGPKKELLTRLNEYSSLIHVAIKEPTMTSIFYRKYIMDQSELTRMKVENISRDELLGLNTNIYGSYLQKILYSGKI